MTETARGGSEPEYAVAPSTPLEAPLLTPADAALLLSVKPSWVYEAVRTGKLPCLRIGRHVRFTRRMLEDWVDSRGPI